MSKFALAAPLFGLSLISTDVPPARFQGEAVAVTVIATRATIDARCGEPPAPDTRIIACHYALKDGTHIVILPEACPYAAREFYARIVCHEFGHVKGWSRWHEQ